MTAKKPYEPLSLFQRMLEEHRNWLFSAGYHERALGAGEEPGRLVKNLRELFGKAVSSTMWHYRVESFEIGVKGVFSAKKDPINFTFQYAYDPHRVRLNLTKLTATLYDQSASYEIHNNARRELPPADLVHAQLRAVIDAQLLERLKEKTQATQRKRKMH